MKACTCQSENKALKWEVSATAPVIIAGENGLPMHVANLSIEVLPLLVEPWMIESALKAAAKHLSRSIANYSYGKILN